MGQSTFETASGFDWQHWVDRFDRMQDRYIPDRSMRFEIIVRTICAGAGRPGRVLDLGCGTGSLSLAILQAFPQCQLVGVDLDQSLLMLARARLASHGDRVCLLRTDLRDSNWIAQVGDGFDAIVSATALHWLSSEHLAQLYQRLGLVLRPGGVFINADHVASDCAAIQAVWEASKKARLESIADHRSDTWPEFWQAYAAAIKADPQAIGSGVVGGWEGVEDGMPLGWHFDCLRAAGFASVECFWRGDGDAIYGAVRANKSTGVTNG